MSEESGLRILLACGRPLVLKAQRWTATLSEEARPYLKTAAEKLRGVVDMGIMEAHDKSLVFVIYPPGPDAGFLRDALKSVVPLKGLRGESAPMSLDAVRPGEEAEAITRGLARIGRDVRVAVHSAATLPEIRQLLNVEPGFHVLHFAGHGGQSGALYFEDGCGSARRVMPDELDGLVRGKVDLLVTGACFSEKAVAPLFPGNGDQAIPAAVCIHGQHPIHARAAEFFSGALYSGLAQGRALKRSFQDALEAVKEDDIVGERAMPDGEEPTPWKRFILKGDDELSFPGVPPGETHIDEIIQKSPHGKIARTERLFVGRNMEIAAIAERLEPPQPGSKEQKPGIITLCGEGGIGKTRLAQASADWLAEKGKFPGGIYEVACDGVKDAPGMALAILKGLGVKGAESLPEPADALAELMKSLEKRALLVLDNLDDLFDPEVDSAGAGQLLKGCLTASPSFSILATCRWALELEADEHAFTVQPMITDEALELFILCIPDGDIQSELWGMVKTRHTRTLDRILNLMAGMPLCIILAAGRLRAHGEGLNTLLEKAEKDMVRTLEDPKLKALPPRLRSLRASLDLSYNRLSKPAMELFARMSFFPGGLYRGLPGASELLGDGWKDAAEELARYALVRYERSTERYTMLHPVMECARGKLDESEGDDFRRRTVELWSGFVYQFGSMLSTQPDVQERLAQTLNLPDDQEERRQTFEELRVEAFTALSAEEENVVHALSWLFGTGDDSGLVILGAMSEYLNLGGRWHTQEQLYTLAQEQRRALAESDPAKYLPDVAMTLNYMGVLNYNMGHPDEALKQYEEALGIYREFFQRYPSAHARNFLIALRGTAEVYEKLGEMEKAAECRREMEEVVKKGMVQRENLG